MTAVETIPVAIPEYLKASGIARIPVPRHPLSKWIRVSAFLKKKRDQDTIRFSTYFLQIYLNTNCLFWACKFFR